MCHWPNYCIYFAILSYFTHSKVCLFNVSVKHLNYTFKVKKEISGSTSSKKLCIYNWLSVLRYSFPIQKKSFLLCAISPLKVCYPDDSERFWRNMIIRGKPASCAPGILWNSYLLIKTNFQEWYTSQDNQCLIHIFTLNIGHLITSCTWILYPSLMKLKII